MSAELESVSHALAVDLCRLCRQEREMVCVDVGE